MFAHGVFAFTMVGPHGDTHRTGVEEGVHLVSGGLRRLTEHGDGHRGRVPAPLGRQGIQALLIMSAPLEESPLTRYAFLSRGTVLTL